MGVAYKYEDEEDDLISDYVDDAFEAFVDFFDDIVIRYDKANPSALGVWYYNQANTITNSMSSLSRETDMRYKSMITWTNELHTLIETYKESDSVQDTRDFDDAETFLESIDERLERFSELQAVVKAMQPLMKRYTDLLKELAVPVEIRDEDVHGQSGYL